MDIELTQDHLIELTELVAAIENFDEAPFRTMPSELLQYFDEDFETRTIGYEFDGVLAGYGVVRMPHGEGNLRCSGGIHPSYRGEGLGTKLVEWFEKAAQELAGNDSAAVMEIHVEESRDELSDILSRKGFKITSGYVQFRRDLSVEREEIEAPHLFELRSWSEVEGTDMELSYREHIGPEVSLINDRFFVPEWSFVLIDKHTDRSKIAAFLLSHRYEQDWEASGWTEGYTEVLSVQPEYRGLHLATYLLNVVADVYQKDGMQYATVDLESDQHGHSDLEPLFSSLDYEPTRHTKVYTRRVFKKKSIRPVLPKSAPPPAN